MVLVGQKLEPNQLGPKLHTTIETLVILPLHWRLMVILPLFFNFVILPLLFWFEAAVHP